MPTARSMCSSPRSPARSIAVAATVRPSRSMAALVLIMGVVLLIAAAVLQHEAASPFHQVLAFICAIAGGALSLFPLLAQKSFRIDVTGIGQIRLVDTSRVADAGPPNQADSSGEVVQLLGDSTFWSSLMVLRLQSGSGRVTVLTIFPDSMDCRAFHALSVACRWVAARQFSSGTRSSNASLQSD